MLFDFSPDGFCTMNFIVMYLNIILLLAAVSGGYGQDRILREGPLQDSGSVLEGRILDRGSGIPLGEVIVRWEGTAHSVLSKADGTYRISIHPGSRKLVFSKPGWRVRAVRVYRGGKRDVRMRKIKRNHVPAHAPEDLPPDSLSSTDHAPVEGTP